MSIQDTISATWLENLPGAAPHLPSVQCDWLEDAAEQFRAIVNLPHGWDSYGSPPPDVRILKSAWSFLYRLCQIDEFPKPHINPIPDGGVQFDWEVGSRYFEIVFISEVQATYLFGDSDAGVEESGEVALYDSPNQILDYIRRVTVGPQRA